MKKELDITGDVCPMTFVRVKMAMDSLEAEGVLEVLLGSEDVTDVMQSVKTEGYRVLKAENEGKTFRLQLTHGE